jgi:hypothetical protein
MARSTATQHMRWEYKKFWRPLGSPRFLHRAGPSCRRPSLSASGPPPIGPRRWDLPICRTGRRRPLARHRCQVATDAPHRSRSVPGSNPVALECWQHSFRQVEASIDAVHDLQRSIGAPVGGGAAGQKVHERGCLVAESQPQKGVDAERSVPDPYVAVVPVPFPADLLWDAGRGRSDDGPGGGLCQQLERQRGPMDDLPPTLDRPGHRLRAGRPRRRPR